MNAINRDAVLSLFSGKRREKAALALDNVEASIALGEWIPNVSRSARAALSKSNVAEKAGKQLDDAIRQEREVSRARDDFSYDYDSPRNKARWEAMMVLRYGSLRSDIAKLNAWLLGDEARVVFERYRDALLPVILAMEILDATRPKPVFTYLGASPTITATMESLDVTKVEVCPMHWERFEKIGKDGKTYYYSVPVLDWPAGTLHRTSKHAHGNGAYTQCEACGHGIRNPTNWCPLLLTAKDGTPKSLWVGRDCAKTLFGIKWTGELELPGVEARS